MKTTLLIGLLTTHIGGHNYNEQNHLRAVQVERVVVGTMINSYSRRSYIAAYDKRGGDNWGVLIGGASGYDYDCLRVECPPSERDASDVIPVISPYYQWRNVTALVQGNALVITVGIDITN